MKKVAPTRYTGLALLLAMSIQISATGSSHAGVWNPKSWFSASVSNPEGQSSSRKLEQAYQRAKLAEQSAEQAVKAAQSARESAEQARREVEALQQNQASGTALKTENPESEGQQSTQTSTEPDPAHTSAASSVKSEVKSSEAETGTSESATSSSEKSAETVHSNLLKLTSPEKAEQAEASEEAQTFVQSAQTETAPVAVEKKQNESWNPLNWFKKNEAPLPEVQQEALTPAAAEVVTTESKEADKEKETTTQAPHTETEATEETSTRVSTDEKQTDASDKGVSEMKVYENASRVELSQKKQEEQKKLEKDVDSATAAQSEQPQAETQAADVKPNQWNPMHWFSGNSEKTAQVSSNKPKQPKTNQKAEQLGTETVAAVPKAMAAVMETEKGNISFVLYPEQAPETVANFEKLVKDGFYSRFNMKFHRVVPGFVIQTGDPTGTGAGGSKTHIQLEAKNKLSHNTKGVVAMARGADPNSASSQFYITLAPQTSLDGKYAIFGKVVAGMDVLDKIEKDDMVYGIKLVEQDAVVKDAPAEKKRFFSSLF